MSTPNLSLSKPFNSITRTLYCQNSGLELGVLEIRILEGHIPYMQAHSESVYLHPFYGMTHSVVLKKLADSLHQHQELNWEPNQTEINRLRVLVSATMYHLGVLKQDRPSLPAHKIAVASAGRLLGIANWFHFISSQRLTLPQFSISQRNNNFEWENFRYWLDAAYLVRDEWARESRKLKEEAKQRAYEQSLQDIKSEAVKRVDLKKVWAWMHIQLKSGYSEGRLETFKNLFLHGDLNICDWVAEDVEDLKIAIVTHCDIGNDLTYFINNRLNGIQALIKDFYTGFTIIRPSVADKFAGEEMTQEESDFFAGYDAKVVHLTEPPKEPQLKDFATKGLFIKAQAQWRILTKRYHELRVK